MKVALYDRDMYKDDYKLQNVIFETSDADIYNILKFKDKYYVVSIISHEREFAGVKEIDYKSKGEQHSYTYNLKCPYCGYENTDSWEMDDSSGEVECGRCGSEYEYEREVSVSYSTYPKKGKDIKEIK